MENFRLLIELENGEKFLCKLSQNNNSSLKLFINYVKELLFLDKSTDFVLFTGPPLEIISSIDQLTLIMNTIQDSQSTINQHMNQQVNFKLYRRETLVKILLKLELEAKKQKQQLSFNELINYTEDELLLSEKDLQLLGNQKNQTQGDLNQVDMFEDLNKQKKISKLKDCMHTEYERVANQIKMKSIKRVPKQNALSKVQNLEIQTKDYKSVLQEWDDDLMDIFHVQEATTHMQLLQQLQPIVHQIGFQVKIDEELQSKEVKLTPQEQINIYDIAIEAQCQFVKFGCAYPLKNCQFYLLYKMFSNGQTLLFACYLSHSHSMGPIPMPPELKPSGNINN